MANHPTKQLPFHDTYDSIVDLLVSRAAGRSEKVAFRFLSVKGTDERVRYGELHARACQIAAFLQQQCDTGDRVLLLYPEGLELIEAFLGCLYAGVIAVPLYPPRPNRKLYRAGKVISDCDAKLALAAHHQMSWMQTFLAESGFTGIRVCSTGDAAHCRETWRLPQIQPQSIAFLQYTSGSTGDPKGVMVSHESLMNNEATITRAMGTREEDTILSWLPLYHDMGLIGSVLQNLYRGTRAILIPTADFIRDPIHWLESIDRHGATVSGGPNFAYDLCLQRITDQRLAKLDLSRWRLAFNGAEPVRAETLQRFYNRFAVAGFRKEAFYPCYGMAEATLFISGGSHEDPPQQHVFQRAALSDGIAKIEDSVDPSKGIPLTACGTTHGQDKLLIMDPQTLQACPDGRVGEIWVATASKALGYWRRDTESQQTFAAQVAGETRSFLRTGDLGFLYQDELYVTGRSKDLIIIRGRNYYPQDLELTAQRAHPDIKEAVAFGVQQKGAERLTLLLEIRRDRLRRLQGESIFHAVRTAISETYELTAWEIGLVKPGVILKTSSGKIRRNHNREAWLGGALPIILSARQSEPSQKKQISQDPQSESGSTEDILGWLRYQVASLLEQGVSSFSDQEPLTSYGLDSIAAVTLQHRIHNQWGVELPADVFLPDQSIAALAEVCERQPKKTIPLPAKRQGGKRFPLSPNQNLLYLQQCLHPEGAAYHMPFAARIKAPLDIHAFHRAWRRLLARHEVLRGCIRPAGDQVMMVILEQPAPFFWEIDARQWDEGEIRHFLKTQSLTPFDLSRGPLLRLHLLRLNDNNFLLLLNMHHLVGDLWSQLVLLDELRLLYSNRDQAALLRPLPLNYGAHAQAEHEFIDTEAAESQWQYWRGQLAAPLPVLQLPYDFPRPPREKMDGARTVFELEPNLTVDLKLFAKKRETTLFALLMSSFQLFLHRISGQDDLLVGTPTNGRSGADYQDLVGYCVNPIIIRSRIDEHSCFHDHLKQIKQTLADALSCKGLPYAVLLERLNRAERGEATQPRAMFALQKPQRLPEAAPFALRHEGARMRLGELDLESVTFPFPATPFDLTLFAAEQEQRLTCCWEYRSDLFEHETATRMARHFVNFLKALVTHPDAPMKRLQLQDQRETHQLLIEWNRTTHEWPNQNAVHRVFEAITSTNEQLPALLEDERVWRYGELNRVANRLARQLPVGGEPIAILLPRSSLFVVAALAVLKAGRAYVPFDPDLPRPRLEQYYRQAGATLLITDRRQGKGFEFASKLLMPTILETDNHTALESNLERKNHLDELAYLIFTSGSTGTPKAVAVSHGALANLCWWHQTQFKLETTDRAPLTASPAFDASVWELWPYLTAGSSVVIVPPPYLTDPEKLRDFLVKTQATIGFLATPLAERIISLDWPAKTSLRLLLTGGDTLQKRSSNKLPFSLINNYGPTEAAVVTTSGRVTALPETMGEQPSSQSEKMKSPPHMGRPITNTRVYVLDVQLDPVPIGLTGELFIGGAGLARCYVNDPRETAQRFIPNLFAKETLAGSRLYRSGDLVRYDNQGRLRFQGRIDHQVKLRGFRIELGEIEHVLAGLVQVRESAVLLREDQPGKHELVAYLCPEHMEPASQDAQESTLRRELRRALAQHLPAYMVPSTFVLLSEMPLNTAGKIDRRALPAPTYSDRVTHDKGLAPRSPIEEKLARIWQERLNLQEIGVHDNFYELGGDSILAIQIAADASTAGLSLRPDQIFQHQTIAELTRYCQPMEREEQAEETFVGPFTPTPIQQWFFDQQFADPHHYNQSVLLALETDITELMIRRNLQVMVDRHDALRLRFALSENCWRAEIKARAKPIPLEVYDRSEVATANPSAEIQRICHQLQSGLNFESGPIGRGALFRGSAPNPSLLFLTFHHLVIDAVSWRIFSEEMRLLLLGEASSSLPRAASFARWGQALKAEAGAIKGRYWLENRALARLASPLPSDFQATDQENTNGVAETLTLVLDKDQTRHLLGSSHTQARVGVDAVLLAILAQTLAEWCGSTQVVMDHESYGRDAVKDYDSSRGVGWFTALFPLVVPTSANLARDIETVGEVLSQIKSQAAEYGLLRYPASDQPGGIQFEPWPQAQIIFNYLGRFDSSLRKPFLYHLDWVAGGDRSPAAQRSHLLEINAMVIEEKLKISWTYSSKHHRESTIDGLITRFEEILRGWINRPEAVASTSFQQPVQEMQPTELPLTPLQQGMLFHWLFHKESGSYFEQLTCVIHGAFNQAAFQKAWANAIAANPILRAGFRWHEAASVAVISDHVNPEWQEMDLSSYPAPEQAAKIERFLNLDRERGFSLQHPPLLRFALFRLGPDTLRFVWSYHHVLLDGWSLALLLGDIFEDYRAQSVGSVPQPRKRPPFTNYLKWLTSRDTHAEERFWRGELRGFSKALELPHQNHGAASDFSNHYRSLPPKLYADLVALTRNRHITMASLLQSAWALLLSRYCHQKDVLFGQTVSGRYAPVTGIENMIGPLINTIPVRARINPKTTLAQWLDAFWQSARRREMQGATALAEMSRLSDLEAGVPLFETLVVFENYPLDPQSLQQILGLRVEDIAVREHTHYPLTLIIIPGAATLQLRASYDGARFNPSGIERLLGHLQKLLESFPTALDHQIGELQMLTQPERKRLLQIGNCTEPVIAADFRSLTQCFEDQVALFPDRSALHFPAEQGRLDLWLTYDQLNQAANRMAHGLSARGIGPEALVGLCMERSLELVVAILGILKTGAAYVPLDPIYPVERLAMMCADADLPLVLSRKRWVSRLPQSGPDIMCFGEFASIGEKHNSRALIAPDQAAYVIYTSGSTGKPKGVVVSHYNAARLFQVTRGYPSFQFDERDVWTLFHSYAFDFSVWEMWGALLVGGRLVVVPFTLSRSPREFLNLIGKEGVTVLSQTPSAFRALTAIKNDKDLVYPTPRTVIFGGEALDPSSLAPLFEQPDRHPPQLVNMYGITETTVHVTHGLITIEDTHRRDSQIGRPLPDLQIFLLDGDLRLVPLGIPGEIYVGGAGLSRGYLKRPDLTAWRFIPHPFSHSPGLRLYRTGDLAVCDENGAFKYLGRMDRQVKIRGFRIELGEIEAVLMGHETVAKALVMVREDLPQVRGKFLIAYLKTKSGSLPDHDTWHAHLHRSLPDYMVPAFFIEVEDWPLTAQGKIDRSALPLPETSEISPSSDDVEAASETEKALAKVWQRVFERDRIGIHNRFFALGGDSILSIRLLAATREAGYHMTLAQLFEHQTIAALAPRVVPANQEESRSYAPFQLLSAEDCAKLPAGLEDAYPLTVLQQGMLFESELQAGSYHNLTSFRVHAPLDADSMRAALLYLMEMHPVLRTGIDPHTFSEPLQLVFRQVEPPLVIEDWRDKAADLPAWFEAEKQRLFRGNEPCLWRIFIHQLDGDGDGAWFRFTLSEHHAIMDGWSVATLLTSLFESYFSHLKGTPPPAPTGNHGFRNYVAQEREVGFNPASRMFWRRQLQELEPTRLPRFPRPIENGKGTYHHLEIEVPEEQSAKLSGIAEIFGVSIKSVLLAVHLRSLGLLCGQKDVCSGLVCGTRSQEEGGDRVLGLFLNTVPFRQNVARPHWHALIRAVFQAEADMLPHCNLPLAEIRKELGGADLFETAFNYTHFHVYRSLTQIEGLELEDVWLAAPTDIPFAANFSRDPIKGQVQLSLDYDDVLLSSEQIEMVAAYYRHALTHLCHNPEGAITNLELIPPSEQKRILRTWNQTQVKEVVPAQSLHALFEQRAIQYPQATALVFHEAAQHSQMMSYAELNRTANRLAHRLINMGAGPEVVIGICLPRLPRTMIALLATLKSGACYLPMDPTYPKERLVALIEDTGLKLVIADRGMALPLSEHCRLVFPETESALDEPETNPHVSFSSLQAAYIITTSGSSGKPKSIVISHAAIVNQILWRQRVFNLSREDRVLQNLSLSFDPSVWQIFWPLCFGAQLHFAASDRDRDIPWLAQLIVEKGITVTATVPSMLAVFLEHEAFRNYQRLYHMSCGGETVPAALTSRFKRQFGKRNILHVVYGPSEATIDACSWPVEPVSPTATAPIGRPIDNATLYILNQSMVPVPVGVSGQLLIGGKGLGRGYVHRPDLTADQYVPNPFGKPGSRLYQTGDMARYLPDGVVEFRGRLDRQVKIRGFRIELGEIESVLAGLDGVAEAAVAVWGSGPKRRLAAFVGSTAAMETDHLPKFCRDMLAKKLPHYMVPSVVTVLSQFPRLANGKIKRAALPGPEQVAGQEQRPYLAPRNELEQALADLWCRVLGLERVGIHDNFFELGGDSIISLQIIARAREMGLAITVKQMFEQQTLAALAQVVRRGAALSAHPEKVAGEVVLTPIQHWFFSATDSPHFNQGVWLETPTDLDVKTLSKALKIVAKHHDSLRLRFPITDRGHEQQYDAGPAEFPLEIWDVDHLDQTQVKAMSSNLNRRFDLEKGPLAAAGLLRVTQHQGLLLLVAHHLVIDGVSWRILLEDLDFIYACLIRKEPLPPIGKTTSYQSWAQGLLDFGQSQAFREQADYWLSMPEPSPMPHDAWVSPEEQLVADGVQVSACLDETRTDQLLGQALLPYRMQTHELLVAALMQVVQRWSAAEEILIDMESHGRVPLLEGWDFSRTVGWFTAIYPFHLKVPRHIPDLLKAVKEGLRGVPDGGIGYGIARYLNPETRESLAKRCPAQISFNYLGQLDRGRAGSVFKLADHVLDQPHDPGIRRRYALEFNCFIRNGQFHGSLTHHPVLHQHSTAQELIDTWLEAVEALLDHCLMPGVGGPTPSDYPLSGLSQNALDGLTTPDQELEDLYPLSPMQEGMLYEALSKPNSGVYHQQLRFSLQRKMDGEAFQQAWQRTLADLPILRSRFLWERLPRPLQGVIREVDLDWRTCDCRDLSVNDREQVVARWLQQDRHRGFQLDRAPIMRFAHFLISDHDSIFIWSHHHILVDGWSLPMIFQRVLTYYQALLEDRSARLPAPPPFRNYIAWLASRDAAGDQAYWRDYLSEFQTVTELPAAGFSAAGSSANGTGLRDEKALTLAATTTATINNMARQHHLTISTLVQAAWAWLLARTSGHRDLIFGFTVSGRPAELQGVEQMVGLFINTLPVRIQVPNDQTRVLPWLAQIQQRAVSHRDHAYCPLARIQSWSEIPTSRALFDSMVVVENYPFEPNILNQAGVTQVAADEQTHFPLTLASEQPAETLTLKLSYDGERFCGAQIEQLLDRLAWFLGHIALDPETALGDLRPPPEFLGNLDLESQQAVFEPIGLHGLFSRRAHSSPHAIALRWRDGRLSYAELEQRAQALAHELRRLGARSETRVGLLMERSQRQMISLLAILKTGAAYLPLDPGFPGSRLGEMLEDAQPILVLTQKIQLGLLPDTSSTVFCIDDLLEKATTEPLACDSYNSQIAYLLYTSGSSGKPKGIAVPHGAVIRHCYAMAEELELETKDRVLQFAGLGFDVSVEEIFPTWMAGASLVLPHREVLDRFTSFDVFLKEQSVTLLNLPAPFWHEWVRHLQHSDRHPPLDLRAIIVGSDRVDAACLAAWRQMKGQATWYNGYGTTETTITSTLFRAVEPLPKTGVPIGRPLTGTTAYVLDHLMQPLPSGFMGELFIGGPGLARGYHGRAGLTAACFLPDPFAGQAGSRIYRTGDRACSLASGALIFAGRNDGQIKRRGFRIEPGEIEAVLRNHQAVIDAVCVPRNINDRLLLPVFIVADLNFPQLEPALDAYLKTRLPAYMVPSPIIQTEALPKTPGGKIDRRALAQWPLPEHNPMDQEQMGEPRTPIESVLAEIWAQVLGRPQVGINENYFELGGDSILSIQIAGRAASHGLSLTPKQIYESQTIAELAATLTTAIGKQHQPFIDQGPVRGSQPLMPIQQWFFDQQSPQPDFFNQALLLEVPVNIDPEHLQSALHYLADHHDALRLRFSRTMAGIQAETQVLGACFPLEVAVCSTTERDSWLGFIESQTGQAQTGLSLEQGPLASALLLFQQPDQNGTIAQARLFITIHHLVVDAFSWTILLNDLTQAYRQIEAGQKPGLPSKTTSFKTWSQWLRDLAQTQEVAAYLPNLTAISNASRLPLDFPAEPEQNREESAQTIARSLSEHATAVLLKESAAHAKAQVQELLLTAFFQALCQWTEGSSVLLDLESHGRETTTPDHDLSRTVGWFTSLYPLSLCLEPWQDSAAVLRHVKQHLRRVPAGGLYFGLLRYLNRETASQLATLPSAQISFNYLGRLDSETSQSFLSMAGESIAAGNCGTMIRPYLLDLNLFIREDQLQVNWTFPPSHWQIQTMDRLADSFISHLERLVIECQTHKTTHLVSSDFPLARLDQERLQRLLTENGKLLDLYPLSPIQQGLLFHALLEPESGAYLEQTHFHLEGPWQIDAFRQAWHEVVQRHEALKVSCRWEQLEQPLQLVHEQVSPSWQIMDLRDASEDNQTSKIQIFKEHDRRQVFDPKEAPLMRFAMFQTGERQWHFIWTYHHLLCDGWSMPIILKDAVNHYQVLTGEKGFDNRPTPSYRRYIAWLAEQDLGEAEAYWRKLLYGCEPGGLPGTYPGVHEKPLENAFGEEIFHLPERLNQTVRHFCHTYRLTLSTLFHGAWAVLLSRYTHRYDVIFGTICSGRPPELKGVERTVGLFINNLPVRVQTGPGRSLLAMLSELGNQIVESESFAYCSLTDIMRFGNLKGGQGLFQTVLAVENYPLDATLAIEDDSCKVKVCDVYEQSEFPLTLTIQPGEKTTCGLRFRKDFFNHRAIASMAEHLLNLLQTMVDGAELNLGRLGLAGPDERGLILEQGRPRAVPKREGLLHEIFARHAAHAPDKIALTAPHSHDERLTGQVTYLTYGQVAQRADQLAFHLSSMGVGSGRFVALLIDRCCDMVAAQLAVLKLGAAFVPLDPQAPPLRLHHMLEDCNPSLIICRRHLNIDLHGVHSPILYLDDPLPAPPATPEYGTDLDPGMPAYMIYTSGTTGRPKGTLIPHRALARLYAASSVLSQIDDRDSWSQFHSPAFDFSIFEIWGALLHRGRLVLVPHWVCRSPLDFAQLLTREYITVLGQTPSAFKPLIPPLLESNYRPKRVVLGGEALYADTLVPMLGDGRVQLVNMYGPTETTCCVTEETIQAEALGDPESIIGKPLADTTLVILDPVFQLVPHGVAGQIHVGGPGLALGYWQRPEVTAAAFLPNPCSDKPGARLYRTGDLGYWRRDGRIVFLGRADRQVKLRGFRLERGEIEAVLRQHPHIAEAHVRLEGSGQQAHLIAYIKTPDAEPSPSPREFLKGRLPDYMVPNLFISLKQFPLTINGKLDEAALPQPEAQQHEYVAPRDEIERALVELWCEVLEREPIGIHDNFFDLGGHSLVAVRLHARMREIIPERLSLQFLFEEPTIAGIAQGIRNIRKASSMPVDALDEEREEVIF